MKLVLTRGLPASGKTTWARAWVAEDSGKRTRVNRDGLRAMMFGGWTGVDRHESAVTTAQHTAVAALLESGWDVVCDDTNLSDRAMNGLRGVAELVGATVEVVDLAGVPPEECERRDARRGDKAVGATVIWGMFERWLKPAEVQP